MSKKIGIASGLGGLGDAACALWVAEGLRRGGWDVTFHTKYQGLAKLFGFKTSDCADPADYIDCNITYNYDLDEHYNNPMPRIDWYWRRLTQHKTIDDNLGPARPTLAEDFKANNQHKDKILVFPCAAWKNREWPMGHWRKLCDLIRRAGYAQHVFVPGDRGNAVSGFHKIIYTYGLSIPEFTKAMAAAKLVICNDSGPAHIAGALGVPVVPIHAIYTPEVLWSHYDNCHPLYPNRNCCGCSWTAQGGYEQFACSSFCSELAGITAKDAFNHIEKLLPTL